MLFTHTSGRLVTNQCHHQYRLRMTSASPLLAGDPSMSFVKVNQKNQIRLRYQ